MQHPNEQPLQETTPIKEGGEAVERVTRPSRSKNRKPSSVPIAGDPLWYKDAIIYEVHVRAFCDSNRDGIGDFTGLTQKLGYLQDLGVNTIWLLPFYPSPLKDDGYDIADYTDVHPAYGTLHDFRIFLRESHRHGLRVITELVLNHTSDQHPWFQRSRRERPKSLWRNFYVWSDTAQRYSDARIIFKDFESSNWTWDAVAKAYYWHRFYSHQPDLNFDHPQVQKSMLQVVDFWLEMGVDGMRLDAVPYLFEREGTNCENLPQTHEFLKGLRRHIDEHYPNRMLLAEANQWPEDAIAYFGQGDECHMAFHFPVMPRLFMAVRMESRFPIIEILQQTPSIPENCQWALFLRNHDELTLEMVTDEERDYMYRVYASESQMRINLGIRRRLGPLLRNNRRLIELLNSLLCALPGTPVIYYGDEIGMGDNIYLGDRNGVRTPMQWSADRNAGFSQANAQRLYLPVIIDPEYHYEALNVEAQQHNLSSLLWWMKRLLTLRKRFKAFGRGSLEFLHPENRKVLAFLRCYQDECILVVANLSRFVQYVELDLSAYKGKIPVELFGHSPFPPIGDLPYLLTLGPHAFYWFCIHSPETLGVTHGYNPATQAAIPTIEVQGRWDRLFEGKSRGILEGILSNYLRGRRWFRGKAKRMTLTQTIDRIVLSDPSTRTTAFGRGLVLRQAQDSSRARRSRVEELAQDSAPRAIEKVPQACPVGLHATPSLLIVLVRVEYTDSDPETYVLTLAFSLMSHAGKILEWNPQAALACVRITDTDEEGLLYEALEEPISCQMLMEFISRRRRLETSAGADLIAVSTRAFKSSLQEELLRANPSMLPAEQSNTSVLYSQQAILKVFRKVEPGINPDLEMGRFLTEYARFPHSPPVLGFLEYRRSQDESLTFAILHRYVPHEGDAWRYTLNALGHYFEKVLSRYPKGSVVPLPDRGALDLAFENIPAVVGELLESYLAMIQLLGDRTAELHLALAKETENASFRPEPFSAFYQRALYQSMHSLANEVFRVLRKRLRELPEALRNEAQQILDQESQVFAQFKPLLQRKISAMRIRTHGDFHLGQVLYTGKDFVFIDFEGEPTRSISERRIKRSALRDVCGMLRSFHYAAYTALGEVNASAAVVRTEDRSALSPWAYFWYVWVSAAYLKAYLTRAHQAVFVPKGREELKMLLDTHLMEKVVYELGYELNNRPDWVGLPIRGLLQLLQKSIEIPRSGIS